MIEPARERGPVSRLSRRTSTSERGLAATASTQYGSEDGTSRLVSERRPTTSEETTV
jgi:hypothetical protein